MPTIEADFVPLLSLLDIQMNMNRQLLTLAEEQRHIIIENEVEKLDTLVKQQSTQLKRLAALEKKRLGLIANLCVTLNLPDQPVVLSNLIPYAPPKQQQDLQNLLIRFSALLEKLKEANNINKLLLQTNIELNELMLCLLTDSADPLNNLYCEDGSKAEEVPAGASLFDHQI
jgi:flagellar biosynthesis/type III secretory pathway chaperone